MNLHVIGLRGLDWHVNVGVAEWLCVTLGRLLVRFGEWLSERFSECATDAVSRADGSQYPGSHVYVDGKEMEEVIYANMTRGYIVKYRDGLPVDYLRREILTEKIYGKVEVRMPDKLAAMVRKAA